MDATVEPLRTALSARGLAVVPEGHAADLSAEEGAYVSVTPDHDRFAVVALRTAALDDPDEPVVGLDEYVRSRLGVEPGEEVSVQPAATASAREASLRLPKAVSIHGDVEATLHERLLDRVLETGVPLTVALPGGESETHVPVYPETVDPDGPAVVTEETSLRITDPTVVPSPADGARAGEPTASYEDVGGLDAELRAVRELVELPLHHPGLFDRLGIDAPTGVLLYGPPGTGKTLLAEAIGAEVDATFLPVDASRLAGAPDGSAVEAVFERAREAAPALVFLDELDAVAPDRGGRRARASDARLVAQLLTELDALEAESVVVLAATNRRDAIDEALRRPGRFDREVEIGVPAEPGREEILEIHTRETPLGDRVDLAEYAAHTHGFVGADLEALVTEAALAAIDRLYDDIDDADRALAMVEAGAAEGLTVGVADLDQGLTAVEPSGLRAHAVDVPTVGWDDVGGLEPVKARLRESVQWPLDHPGAYRSLGIEPAGGVLLYGPPGTGKTLLAKALANEAGCNFLSVKGPELLDRWVGSSEESIRELFSVARAHAPTVVCFDEIDALAPARDGGAGGSNVTERVVAQLLTELDGVDELERVFVVGTTNRPDLLDDALTRPGRLDYALEVPLPDPPARREILEIHTADQPLADDVDLDWLVAESEGHSGAELAAVCREAALVSLRAAAPDGALSAAVDSLAIDRAAFEGALEAVETGGETVVGADD